MSAQFEYGKKPELKRHGTSSDCGLLQRKASLSAREKKADAHPNRAPHGDLTGVPAVGSLHQWLSSEPENIADAPIHYPSPLADLHHVRALTAEDGIHLGESATNLPGPELDALLAHEAAHVAQRASGAQADKSQLEYEAHSLAPDILAGRGVEPNFHASPGALLFDTPTERAAVEAAKKRLVLLNKYADEWAGREGRRLRTAKERDPLLAKRTKMDEGIPEPPGQRQRMETQNLQKLNRAPLEIKLSDDEVRFHVKFQVRFEDQKMAGRFSELKANLEQGIRSTWNQALKGDVFSGHKFVLEPEVTLVTATAARDKNYWLITVRPSDSGQVSYPGCSLPQPEPGPPTSVTDSTCDGGVMSVPPLHIAKPDILGHELLHLFGLVDRYMAVYSQVPGKKTTVQLAPSRETGGRPDPLGSEKGAVLAEDMAFLFDRLGVYEMEENRGLDTLRQMEAQGLTIFHVRAEISRQEEIIKNGGRKPTLFKPRTDFKDKMTKDAENL
jgi:hypothetical protein